MEDENAELAGDTVDTPETESAEAAEPSEDISADTPPAKESATDDELPHDKVQGSKHYKSLQAEFTRKSTALADIEKRFQTYGGADRLLQEAEKYSKMMQSREFQSFMADQQMREKGLDPSTMPPDARAAMEFITSLVDSKVNAQVQPYLAQQQAAQRAHQEVTVAKNLASMSEKYGEDWKELQPVMQEIAASLPPSVVNDLRFETLEGVYLQAMVKSGKFNEFAAKQYQKQLSEKKAKATPKPINGINNGSRAVPQVKSMQDAYKAAKTMLGE